MTSNGYDDIENTTANKPIKEQQSNDWGWDDGTTTNNS